MDTDRVLRLLHQAAIHLRATHGRDGMVIRLPDADEVLVAGDLHGNLANFRKILQQAALAEHPNRHLVLQEFVHGSGRYAGGGCTSHQLLDVLAALKCQFPHRVHLLIGNHELSEWTGRSIAKEGVALNALFQLGVETAYEDRAYEVIEKYHEFFAALPLAVRTENRVFITHSVPDGRHLDSFDLDIFSCPALPPEKRGRNSSVYHLLWGRDVTEATTNRFAQMVDADFLVTGHISCPNGYAAPNCRRVILDAVAAPAAFLLIPTRGTLTFDQLTAGIHLLDA